MTFGVDKQGRRETNPVICDGWQKLSLFFLQARRTGGARRIWETNYARDFRFLLLVL